MDEVHRALDAISLQAERARGALTQLKPGKGC
jgi:hypothetical protein